jgi:uncharacterized protein (DUF488 family)
VARVVYTVGHSTRSAEELLSLLGSAEVGVVADVRRFPGSRRHPQFRKEALKEWLPGAGIEYVHLSSLGGRRVPVQGSMNGGWREPAFQGYADHMGSDDFAVGFRELVRLAGLARVAVMCAEALWWRCHRRLIADALTVGGWRVEHLGVGGEPAVHELPSFAVADAGRVSYPAPQGRLVE